MQEVGSYYIKHEEINQRTSLSHRSSAVPPKREGGLRGILDFSRQSYDTQTARIRVFFSFCYDRFFARYQQQFKPIGKRRQRKRGTVRLQHHSTRPFPFKLGSVFSAVAARAHAYCGFDGPGSWPTHCYRQVRVVIQRMCSGFSDTASSACSFRLVDCSLFTTYCAFVQLMFPEAEPTPM